MASSDQRNEFSGTLNSYGAPIVAGAQLSTAGGSIYIGSRGDDDRLPVATEALFNSLQRQHDPTCLPNTRVNLLNERWAWADGQNTKCLWLSGVEGTGKSTIARTIAREYMDKHRLGATFFFSKGRGDAGNASKFFVTIAAQLAQHSPVLRRHVYDAVSANSSIVKQGLHDQWKQLVVQPLARLDSGAIQQPLLLVVDALDECDSDDNIELIVELLARAHETKAVPLRVLLTSRPELPIRNGFAHISPAAHQDVVLHAISSHIVAHDLAVFLRHRLGEVQRKFHLPATWPGEGAIQALLTMTGGLFIWADTACRFIRDGRQFADARLSAILSGRGRVTAPEQKLDSIYNSILAQVVDDGFSAYEKDLAYGSLRRVLSALALLSSPLAIPSLAKLLGMPEAEIVQALDGMRSVLDFSDHRGAVTLHHPSFRDFLLSPHRCADGRLQVVGSDNHQALAQRCLRVMAGSLKKDICLLQRPGIFVSDISPQVIDSCLPAHLQYACLNWVPHFKSAEVRITAGSEVHAFLKGHYLHWLEVLSLLRRLPDGLLWMNDLEDMIEREDSLSALVHDGVRFLQSFRAVIEVAPLQTYASALVFAPEACLVRHEFRLSLPAWITRFPSVQYGWTNLLQELEGHAREVTRATFSPDGQTLATASKDCTVKLWSARTGALRSTLAGHSQPVDAVAFSPDGLMLATAAAEGLVKLWRSGSATLLAAIRTQGATVGCVAFTPDGRALVIADWMAIRFWDTRRRAFAAAAPADVGAPVRAVKFSPDGRLFAYHYYRYETYAQQIVVCRHSAGSLQLGPMAYEQPSALASAFSHDSKLLAVANRTVYLYAAATGDGLCAVNTFPSDLYITALSFSSDRARLVCGTSKGVTLLDVMTSSLSGPFQEDVSRVNDVSHSPTGALLASASEQTIKVWRPILKNGLTRSRPKLRSIQCIDFSACGRLLAVTDSHSMTVESLDPYTGMTGFNCARADMVAFSADGRYVAALASDLKVWHTRSGALRAQVDHTYWKPSGIEFSPDGSVVAIGSYNGGLHLWEWASGVQRAVSQGNCKAVTALAFSADGAYIAAGLSDSTITVWRPATGALHCTLSGHALPVQYLSFPSPAADNDEHIASVSDDQTVRLWHLPSGHMVQMHPLSAFPGFVCMDASGSCLRASYRGALRHTLADCLLATAGGDDEGQPRHAAVDGEWLVWGRERLLWLPRQYRPTVASFSGNLIALGCDSGQWAVIGLDVGMVQALVLA